MSGHHRVRGIRTVAIAIPAVALLALAASRGLEPSPTSAPAAVDLAAERVARGQYLVTIGGCNDCHTPWIMGEKGPEPDMTRMLSGHPSDMVMPPAAPGPGPWIASMAATNTAFAGPWGVSFAANLTPDELTGTGAWTEEIFISTLRSGKHWGQSRDLLPPMPWFNYGKMTDEDLESVFAYLRTIPARRNAVPLPIPPGGPELTAENVLDAWVEEAASR